MTEAQIRHSDLKPCPFCGGRARLGSDGLTRFRVTCETQDCRVEVATFTVDDGAEAVRLWNTRGGSDQ